MVRVETLTRKQLSKLLVYDDDVKTRAERDSYPGHTLSGRCRSEKKQETIKTLKMVIYDKKNESGSSNANGTGMIQKEDASMVSDGAIDKEHKKEAKCGIKGGQKWGAG